jgi:hypothetical protein
VVVRTTNHIEESIPYSYSKYEKYIGEKIMREGLKNREMEKLSYHHSPYKLSKNYRSTMAGKPRIFRTNVPRVYFDQMVMREETEMKKPHTCTDIFSKYGMKTFASKENPRHSLGIAKPVINENDSKRTMSLDDLSLIETGNPILRDEVAPSTNFTSVGLNSRLSENNEADVSRNFQATYWH